MDFNCLLVDLEGVGLSQEWQALIEGHSFALPVSFASDVTEAEAMLNSGTILVMVVFSRDMSPEIQILMRSYQANAGCLPEFQAIVCDDPDPVFMAGVYEFGIDQFFSKGAWPSEVAALTRSARDLTGDESSTEARSISLARSIRSADQVAIQAAAEELAELATIDYRAAFARGRACEAAGDYGAAVEAFRQATQMNHLFRPAWACLGETLLVTGHIDESLDVFRQMERSNPYDVERKANIAIACVEKGDFDQAQKFVEQAGMMAPDHSKVLEAQAQVLLCTGKVGEAFRLMDRMSEVGPFFAAKLNELGIQLSQAGKGKSALALYQKAHKIVRPELRYKISLNAALACRRLQAWDMALKYLMRCQKEYGGSFSKLEKIKESLLLSKAQGGGGSGGLPETG